MHPYPGTPLLEYFPKKPVKCPDPPFFRILQDSMAKIQDSMASSGVRDRSFSYAGETVPLRRQDSMGQYGRLVFAIAGWSRFTENSALRRPIGSFSRICRWCMMERGPVREKRFCQRGPRPTRPPSGKKPGRRCRTSPGRPHNFPGADRSGEETRAAPREQP
jgi:hypothetical protein